LAADSELLLAWLTGRSLARGLPQPAAEFGGFRIDTKGEKEVCRWVFASITEGLKELGRSIREPRYLLKLCGTAYELADALPPGWRITDSRWFMRSDGIAQTPGAVPTGYRLKHYLDGPVVRVEITTEGGDLAASGHAAETAYAFVYDRIETIPQHRRRGLARAVMAALGSCRQSSSVQQLLVATAEGEKLYSSLGWRKLSPYSTAYLPEN